MTCVKQSICISLLCYFLTPLESFLTIMPGGHAEILQCLKFCLFHVIPFSPTFTRTSEISLFRPDMNIYGRSTIPDHVILIEISVDIDILVSVYKTILRKKTMFTHQLGF